MITYRRIAREGAALLCALLLASCGAGPASPTVPSAPAPTRMLDLPAPPPPTVVVQAPATPAATAAPTAAAAELKRFTAFNMAAPALANNLLGEPAERTIFIYLPPSYAAGAKRYPVIYYLPGYTDSAMLGVNLPDDLDKLAANGAIKEAIVVIANGLNLLGGSFYVNSPVTGNWEDFITHDLVEYIDDHYRTIPQASSRGITGHSMGGFGALNIAMKHPDVFSAVYSMSPGLFDEQGLAESQMFAEPSTITSFLDYQQSVRAQPKEKAQSAMMASGQNFTVAYGLAFAPNPDAAPPYLDYPYAEQNGQMVRDGATWRRWENGFGGFGDKVRQYKANLTQLSGLVIDYGRNDQYAWIPKGCEYVDAQLTAAGIPHQLVSFDGGHESHLALRIREHMLPFFSEKLVFD
jgi:S-formylglutathione hydrolase FrmB